MLHTNDVPLISQAFFCTIDNTLTSFYTILDSNPAHGSYQVKSIQARLELGLIWYASDDDERAPFIHRNCNPELEVEWFGRVGQATESPIGFSRVKSTVSNYWKQYQKKLAQVYVCNGRNLQRESGHDEERLQVYYVCIRLMHLRRTVLKEFKLPRIPNFPLNSSGVSQNFASLLGPCPKL